MTEINNPAEMPSVDLTQDPLQKPEGQHPYWQDLNPDFLKGTNYGEEGPHPELSAATAYDIKSLHNHLQDIPDEDLKQVPIMPAGSRLEQGATYIDLRTPQPQEFTATGNMEATDANWYVPKSNVPYWIWNRLTGVENPERLDQS